MKVTFFSGVAMAAIAADGASAARTETSVEEAQADFDLSQIRALQEEANALT